MYTSCRRQGKNDNRVLYLARTQRDEKKMAKIACILAIIVAVVSLSSAAPASENNPTWTLARSMIQTKLHKMLANIPPEIIDQINAGIMTHSPAKREEEADNNIPTPQMIANEGYPAEIHSVTTEDGYILQMHRIPHGLAPGSGPGEGTKTPVFVQHGLLCSSADWVVTGPSEALGYKLADAGYDVWLGNIRGNTYSKNHVSLSPDESEFWQYDWDQHGKYDVPAMMDKISDVSGKQDMFYIGHSMGTTMFWVMSNERPEYRDRIKGMFALAPVARVDHMLSPISYIAPFVDEVNWIMTLFGLDEFLPSDAGINILADLFCIPGGWIQDVCSNILFILCGYDEPQLPQELLPTILGHTPAGTSTRTIVHYAQGVNSGAFQKYDFGPSGNMDAYGAPYPPEYDRDMITSPVYAYWADNDWLAHPEDVAWLMRGLPNLQLDYRVPLDMFNHLDYLWAIDVDILPQMIANEGYPAEIHSVTTEDGYILQMHRIPHGLAPGSGPGEGSKTPVFVQHGLLSSSADWVVTGPSEALGYKLADAGYDVWLGNSRGNTYSKNHWIMTLFGLDEFLPSDIGINIFADLFCIPGGWIQDVCSNILFLLGGYDEPQLPQPQMIANEGYPAEIHSVTTEDGYILQMHRIPHGLAPGSGPGEGTKTPVFVQHGLLSSSADWVVTGPSEALGYKLADAGYDVWLGNSRGNTYSKNHDLLPTILGHVPAGSSTRTIVHYAQGVNSGAFQKYDFGPSGNMDAYGTPYPPEYDRDMITSPVYAYWADNDWLAQPENINLKPQIISNDGYPSETHQVTTEDGYILEMHRIPHGVAPGSGPGEGSKTPVYVQHGILCSSADWVLSGPEESLAYKLADAGYDVWLGNLRGNTYSKGHESLTEKDSEFWQFDWDQHGKYDAPAMMDLITSVTGKQEMFYIGHSMGSTMFWVLSNERPEYRDRIKGMFALAPVSRVDHMMSPIASIAPFIDELSWILLYFGLDEFLPSDIGIGFLAELICIPGGWSAAICSNILFLICGFDEAQLNEELLPTILGHTPAGTSTRTMAHYAQQVNSGTFSKFDYGPTCNMETYGTPYPPEYERKMVTSPVYAYWSDNDWLAQPEVYSSNNVSMSLMCDHVLCHIQKLNIDKSNTSL
ncbi:unnamed protein product [Notodromas monacha]|uniref:Triacylglycerol lipase n=1 Tax=Notodromas monacha TaxID=399045 RepID=A0A7R9BQR2_9CRUS|nr:unnamed protein product [Notodromas monacha]CAG0919966.1 unnamed protein product [Notodromas monacha]